MLSSTFDSLLPHVSQRIIDLHAALPGGKSVIGTAGRNGVIEFLEQLRRALFPGVYDSADVSPDTARMYVSARLRDAGLMLYTLLCSAPGVNDPEAVVTMFMDTLPDIRELLSLDIKAAYDGDPAAHYYEEILLSYPGFEAVMIYRFAHVLYSLNVPVIPRIMTEYAHQRTGIDINPGAVIGKRFFIDHGTGVVIGETCVIGDNVKMYQGVTLGARSFDLDEQGNPIKGIKRHPDIEDDVVIYAGATILGGDTRIGRGSVIGGNVWLTNSVPAYSKVYNASPAPIIR
jgi:serine O-acetyltransferase